jgi:hypothetical protein
LPTN